jgi:hypothetical protein
LKFSSSYRSNHPFPNFSQQETFLPTLITAHNASLLVDPLSFLEARPGQREITAFAVMPTPTLPLETTKLVANTGLERSPEPTLKVKSSNSPLFSLPTTRAVSDSESAKSMAALLRMKPHNCLKLALIKTSSFKQTSPAPNALVIDISTWVLMLLPSLLPMTPITNSLPA